VGAKSDHAVVEALLFILVQDVLGVQNAGSLE
jgi:hypothetical protein